MSDYFLIATRDKGPLPGIVEFITRLHYFDPMQGLALWDFALWDDEVSALWEGDPEPKDVICDVETISVTRGRDEPLSRFEPATATVTVADPEGVLSPWSTATDAHPYNAIRPGITLDIAARVLADDAEYPIFTGHVTQITDTFPTPRTHNVQFDAVDALDLLASYDGEEQSLQGDGELAAPRIARILGTVQYAGPTSIDEGTTPLQPTTLDGNMLDHASDVADCEPGALFVDASGTLIFRDANGIANDERYTHVQAIFGDEDDELCYKEISLNTDATLVRNLIRISNDQGAVFTLRNEDSIALYKIHTFERTDLIHKDDAHSETIARVYDATFAFGARRVDQLVVAPHIHPETVVPVLTLDVLWRIEVRRRAPGLSVVAELQLERIDHEITPTEWNVTYRTFDASAIFAAGRWDQGEWDSAEWGF